ncbi:hypothetical protein DPMN_061324, partial [Dreissena polymorpha]
MGTDGHVERQTNRGSANLQKAYYPPHLPYPREKELSNRIVRARAFVLKGYDLIL